MNRHYDVEETVVNINSYTVGWYNSILANVTNAEEQCDTANAPSDTE